MSKMKGTFPLQKARKVANKIVKEIDGKSLICGSIRRKVDFVGDIDIVSIKNNELVEKILNLGFEIKDSWADNVIEGIPVTIYFADSQNWGSMIMHFTGSKELNIMMRGIARKKGMMLNQYGLFEGSDRIASRTEEEIYDKIGMRYLKPTERNKSFE